MCIVIMICGVLIWNSIMFGLMIKLTTFRRQVLLLSSCIIAVTLAKVSLCSSPLSSLLKLMFIFCLCCFLDQIISLIVPKLRLSKFNLLPPGWIYFPPFPHFTRNLFLPLLIVSWFDNSYQSCSTLGHKDTILINSVQSSATRIQGAGLPWRASQVPVHIWSSGGKRIKTK